MMHRLHGGPAVRTDRGHMGPTGVPKIGFETKRSARARARTFASKFSQSYRAYRCVTCSLWHLASEHR